MFLKKLFLSLGALGVVGGSGAGIYFIKNQTNNKEIKEIQKENLPIIEVPLPPQKPAEAQEIASKEGIVDTSQRSSQILKEGTAPSIDGSIVLGSKGEVGDSGKVVSGTTPLETPNTNVGV